VLEDGSRANYWRQPQHPERNERTNVDAGYLITDHGLQGDAHTGTGRPISFFSAERVEEPASGVGISIQPGDFAENITARGLCSEKVKPGTRLLVGKAVVEVMQIGKQDKKESIFCGVVKSGRVKVGDNVFPVN
jgi:MOSC domain-containing protein YiiM